MGGLWVRVCQGGGVVVVKGSSSPLAGATEADTAPAPSAGTALPSKGAMGGGGTASAEDAAPRTGVE
jgi:hypothetical protein